VLSTTTTVIRASNQGSRTTFISRGRDTLSYHHCTHRLDRGHITSYIEPNHCKTPSYVPGSYLNALASRRPPAAPAPPLLPAPMLRDEPPPVPFSSSCTDDFSMRSKASLASPRVLTSNSWAMDAALDTVSPPLPNESLPYRLYRVAI